MRLYVAGPMTGIPQFNYPAFIDAAVVLRATGHDVVSPAELDDPDDRAAALASKDGHMLSYTSGTGKTWGDFLARDVKLIADGGIDGIVVLDGWAKSRGARLETFVGNLCGLPAYPLWTVPWLVPLRMDELSAAWTGLDASELMDLSDPYWDCQCGACVPEVFA